MLNRRKSIVSIAALGICVCLSFPMSARSEQLTVDAGSAWSAQTSGTIPTNSLVSITASGSWVTGSWTGGPEGDTASGPQGGSYIMPDANPYSLIGKVGDAGIPFAVGSDYVGVAGASGTVRLGMNDVPGIFGDNDGSLSANVDVYEIWHTIDVSASQSWAGTSFLLAAGQPFIIDAQGSWGSGTWTGGPGGYTEAGPIGEGYLAPGEMAYGLIGRINGGEPFFVGERFRGIADVCGILELGMNDVPGIFGDNHGTLSATIGIPEPASLALLGLGGLALLRSRRSI